MRYHTSYCQLKQQVSISNTLLDHHLIISSHFLRSDLLVQRQTKVAHIPYTHHEYTIHLKEATNIPYPEKLFFT